MSHHHGSNRVGFALFGLLIYSSIGAIAASIHLGFLVLIFPIMYVSAMISQAKTNKLLKKSEANRRDTCNWLLENGFIDQDEYNERMS